MGERELRYGREGSAIWERGSCDMGERELRYGREGAGLQFRVFLYLA